MVLHAHRHAPTLSHKRSFKRSQTVRVGVRKPFVWGVTWGNTDPQRRAFAPPFARKLPRKGSEE